MNPADTTLESEIITLVPPPASKPPRSSLAVAAFIGSLVPVPLLFTLSAVPLALASLIGIGRSRTPVRGVGFALAALVLCAAQWLVASGLLVVVAGDNQAHRNMADTFIPTLGDAVAMRPFVAADISRDDLAAYSNAVRNMGRITEWRLVDSDYHGLWFGEHADERRFAGEYVYRLETESGPVRLDLFVQTRAGIPTVTGFRTAPIVTDPGPSDADG